MLKPITAQGAHARRRHEVIGSVVRSDSGVSLPCVSARLTSAVGDSGGDTERRGVVSLLSLRG